MQTVKPKQTLRNQTIHLNIDISANSLHYRSRDGRYHPGFLKDKMELPHAGRPGKWKNSWALAFIQHKTRISRNHWTKKASEMTNASFEKQEHIFCSCRLRTQKQDHILKQSYGEKRTWKFFPGSKTYTSHTETSAGLVMWIISTPMHGGRPLDG